MIRMLITIPRSVKSAIERASLDKECSEAEIVRVALYYHLKEYIKQDVKK